MYLVNDLLDVERDKIHLFKRFRPIAQGALSKNVVLATAVILTSIGLYLSLKLSSHLFAIAIIFVLLQLSYNLFFKSIILFDIVAIATTFMLRVFAGSLVVLVPLSSWLILTTIMLALFLATGKRRSELTLLTERLAGKHRKTLYHYHTNLLDGITFMMGAATLITYSLFTFNEPELQSKGFIVSFLPQTLASPKWLMITIPLVVYGILRYLYLIFEVRGEDSPEKILVKDYPLFATVLLWALSILAIIYVLPSS
jgi:4-hydroxybenzoate polyprenyltransferase